MKASDFAAILPGCSAEVLDAMYFTSILDAPARETADRDTIPPLLPGDFAFALDFSGDISGGFGLHVDASTASTLAANFLGEDVEALTREQVAESIGELANILCGSVLSRVDARRKFVLSHPRALEATPADSDLNRDCLINRLETDSGAVTTWISVDWIIIQPTSTRLAQ